MWTLQSYFLGSKPRCTMMANYSKPLFPYLWNEDTNRIYLLIIRKIKWANICKALGFVPNIDMFVKQIFSPQRTEMTWLPYSVLGHSKESKSFIFWKQQLSPWGSFKFQHCSFLPLPNIYCPSIILLIIEYKACPSGILKLAHTSPWEPIIKFAGILWATVVGSLKSAVVAFTPLESCRATNHSYTHTQPVYWPTITQE